MAEGRSQALWNHTSSVLAMLANVNRDPRKGRSAKPADFNPHTQPKATALPRVKLSEVKDKLMGIKPKRPRKAVG